MGQLRGKKNQLNYYSYLSNLSIITDTNRMAQRIIIQEVVEFLRNFSTFHNEQTIRL